MLTVGPRPSAGLHLSAVLVWTWDQGLMPCIKPQEGLQHKEGRREGSEKMWLDRLVGHFL